MKSVLITGANKGIGFETAKQLASLGYFVYIGSRDKAKGLKAVEKLKALGFSNVDCIELDVTNIFSIKSCKSRVRSKNTTLRCADKQRRHSWRCAATGNKSFY